MTDREPELGLASDELSLSDATERTLTACRSKHQQQGGTPA